MTYSSLIEENIGDLYECQNIMIIFVKTLQKLLTSSYAPKCYLYFQMSYHSTYHSVKFVKYFDMMKLFIYIYNIYKNNILQKFHFTLINTSEHSFTIFVSQVNCRF